MYIIAGLGNPGPQYAHTRHNAGFNTVDVLSEKWRVPLNKTKHKALYGEGMIGEERIVLSKPQTFMNASGESIVDMVNWYKIPLSNLIIIYDDIDLDVGKLRVRPKGSAGTHNGMRSIIYQLQGDQFPRVRIGIGGPPPRWDLVNYVLGRFAKEEEDTMLKSFIKAAEAVETIITKGVQEAMNCFNG